MKTRSRRRPVAPALLLALPLLACGSDEAPGRSGSENGGDGRNGGMMRDGGADEGDTGTGDDGPNGPLTCDLDPEEFSVEIDDRGSRTWGALQVNDTIHLVYETPVCEEEPAAQAQRVDYLKFKSTGAFGAAKPVAGGAAGECHFTRTPCLARLLGQDPLLFYSSNALGGNELFQAQLGGDSKDLRLTNDAASALDLEEHTVVAPFGASPLLAYVNAGGGIQGAGVGSIVTRRVAVGSTFPEQEVLAASAGVHISGLALAAFSDEEGELGGVLAWVADAGPTPGIVAQLLDRKGRPSGSPVTLSDQVGAFSNVSIQMLPHGADPNLAGAIVYGVAPDEFHTELRFRTVGLDGSFGDEFILTDGLLDAQGIGIAYFGGGYILVYRVLVGADTTMNVRIVDLQGNSATYGGRILVHAETSGSAPRVFVTSDGRISTVFTDVASGAAKLRVVRATCDP